MLIQPPITTTDQNFNKAPQKLKPYKDRYKHQNMKQNAVNIFKSRAWQLSLLFLVAWLLTTVYLFLRQTNPKIEDFYDFSKLGQVIEAKQELNKNYMLTKWPQLSNQTISGRMTAVFTTSRRPILLYKTLKSFFKHNTYPLQKVIVVQDGQVNKQLYKIIKQFKNITWIITNHNVGQIAAIDIAYKFIETQYYFHSEDDWQFTRPGFIQYCLYGFKVDPKVRGFYLRHTFNPTKLAKKGIMNIVTYRTKFFFCCFTLNPSVHYLSDYTNIPGGYGNLTFHSSFGKGAGDAEALINILFIKKGYYSGQSHIQFIKHLGVVEEGGGEKYQRYLFWESQNRKVIRAFTQFLQQRNQKTEKQLATGIQTDQIYHKLYTRQDVNLQIDNLYVI